MRAVLLNDTHMDGHHFGCTRVMAAITGELARRRVEIVHRLPVGVDWRAGPETARALSQVGAEGGAVVINGEGTLHHGRRRARALLEAGAAAAATGAQVWLVNALWQDNPESWAGLVQGYAGLWCRDRRSAAALAAATGRPVGWMPDLSMLTPPPPSPDRGAQILFGDSVRGRVTLRLARTARAMAADGQPVAILPVARSRKTVGPRLRGLRRLLRRAEAAAKDWHFLRQYPMAAFADDPDAYLQRLGAARLSVTGRFHAVCLAVLTGTPFVALASNSWKIEALIEDMGLDPARLLQPAELSPDLLLGRDWSYSQAEQASIDRALARLRRDAGAMFDRIATGG